MRQGTWIHCNCFEETPRTEVRSFSFWSQVPTLEREGVSGVAYRTAGDEYVRVRPVVTAKFLLCARPVSNTKVGKESDL